MISIRKTIEVGGFWLVLAILFSAILFYNPAFTGKSIDENIKSYTYTVNRTFDMHDSFIFEPELTGELTSVQINGFVVGMGSIEVRLVKGDESYLIYRNNNSSGMISITGLEILDNATYEIIPDSVTDNEMLMKNLPNENHYENITGYEENDTNSSLGKSLLNESKDLEEELPETRLEPVIIKNACADTCLLSNLISNRYEIQITAEDASIHIDSVLYTIRPEDLYEVTFVKDIENIQMNKNTNYTINLSGHFESAFNLSYYAIFTENITTISHEDSITFIPDKNYSGITSTVIFAVSDSEHRDSSNTIIINVSDVSDNYFIEDTANNTLIKIGEPVRWRKKIVNPGKLGKFVLPDSAYNITVLKGEINVTDNSRQNGKIKEKSFVVAKELIFNPSEYIVEFEYYTDGPRKEEIIDSPHKKQVKIISDMHYEKVLAYSDIIDSQIDSIKLYWLKDTGKELFTNITYIDTDGSGLIDRIEWIVPHLSNQTFEIMITILNPITYLRDGETWIVAFNTTGIGNLSISSPNAGWTEFLRDNPDTFDEMRFVDLKCGDISLNDSLKLIGFNNVKHNYSSLSESDSIDVQKLLIEDYECNDTGYISNYMVRAGYATLLFEFSDMNRTVSDIAIDPAYSNTSFGMAVYSSTDKANTTFYRIWNGTNFGNKNETIQLPSSGSQVEWVVSRSSTRRDQDAVAVIDDDGDILINIYNVTDDSWDTWLDVADIGTTNDAYRGFGLQPEDTTGDFLFVYEKNTTADRDLLYRTWNGVSWSNEGRLTLNSDVTAEAQLLVRLDRQSNSEEIMMVSRGAGDDISAVRWDGNGWKNTTTITLNAADINEESLAVDYESLSGDSLLIWGNSTSAYYNVFDNTTKNWSASAVFRDRAAVVEQVSLCSDPTSNYIGAVIGPDSTRDMLAVMWNGTDWLSGEPSEDMDTHNGATNNADCVWTNGTGLALFSYVDYQGLALKYFAYNRSANLWNCPKNGTVVTSLDKAEGANGPCTTGNRMADDITTLRSVADDDSNNITLWAMDIDFTLETFIFNGTQINQSANSYMKSATGWLSTTEPGFFNYLRYPGAPSSYGTIFYGDFNTSPYLRYRIFNGTDYGVEKTAPDLGPGFAVNFIEVKSSTKRDQAAVGVLTDDGNIFFNVYNYSANTFSGWLLVSEIGITNDVYRAFDIASEDTTGDFLAVYDINVQNMAADRKLYYRTWNGTDWSNENNFTYSLSSASEAQLFIQLEPKPNTEEIMLSNAGDSDDVTATRWDGNSWKNTSMITANAAAVNQERFNVKYESLSGDAMIMYGTATTSNYSIFNSTSQSWSTSYILRNRGAAVYQTVLCNDPLSDYMGGMIGQDANRDLLSVIWNGTDWLSGEPYYEDDAEEIASVKNYCMWTKNSSAVLFNYVDRNALSFRYYIYNITSGNWTCPIIRQTVTNLSKAQGSDGPCNTGNIMSNDIEVLRSITDINSNDLMLWGNDEDEDFEMFIFNGTGITQPSTALLEQTTSTTASNIEPVYFDYFKVPYAVSHYNFAPSIESLTTIPATPNTTSELECYATPVDNESSTLIVEWYWYKNGVIYSNGNTTDIANNTNSFITRLGAGNTTRNEIWNCTVRAFDGEKYSEYNSTTVQIENIAPNIVSNYISPAIVYSNDSLTGYCSAEDIDNDSIMFHYKWYRNQFENVSSNTSYYPNGTITQTGTIPDDSTSSGEDWTLSCLASDGNLNSSWLNNSVIIQNYVPQISWVNSSISVFPVEGSTKRFRVQFNVTDPDGYLDINMSSLNVTLNMVGEMERSQESCSEISHSQDTVFIYCSMRFYYYDRDGLWIINISVQDNNNELDQNSTVTLSYGTLTAIIIGESSINYSSTGGDNALPYTGPLHIDNTGNQNITQINITAYDLGYNGYTIAASNFKVNNTPSGGAGNSLLNMTSVNITNATLPRDINGVDQNRSLFFYLNLPFEGYPPGLYASVNPWMIEVN